LIIAKQKNLIFRMAEEGSNRRIVKNTLFLYFRSFLMMAVNLYSSRVILQALGIEDYGLYGAIGSIVAMFTFINGTLSAGTSRFLTFELGRKDSVRLQKTFSASFAMHSALAVVLLILMETLGLWFVNAKMNIPVGREIAANVVFQLSILTCMFSLTQVPYNATIIAHEKMNIYAYVGIAEALFKLSLVLFLLYIPTTDNLIAFAIILAGWSIGLQVFYRYYCYQRFPESHLSLCREKSIYKGMLSYSLWDFLGSFCAQGMAQGVNLLINIFFGVSVNAARAVAYQVDSALQTFTGNFMTSVTPQITKSYAVGDKKRFFQLINESGRFSFMLFGLFSIPLMLEAPFVLSIWLKQVPDQTVVFLRFVLAIVLFRTIARPLIMGVHATGDVKFLNLSAGLVNVITYLPSIYLLFKAGQPVWSLYYTVIALSVISSILEGWSLYRKEPFDVWFYVKDVYLRSFVLTGLASLPTVFVYITFGQGWVRLILLSSLHLVTMLSMAYFFAISKETQKKIVVFLQDKFRLTKYK